MSNFTKLVSKIKALLEIKPHIVIAISGFGGAGKSHLSDRLRDYFKIKDDQVVRIDNLYGPNPKGPDIFDQSDWPLINIILQNVRAGKKLQYQGKDDKGKILYFNEELPKVVIFEGIRLLQPNLLSYFDISVWIDCPQDFAIQRAKTRDRAQGDDEQTVSGWDTDWGPKDKKYFERYRPDQLANFIYEDYR
jgi:uridine kinase